MGGTLKRGGYLALFGVLTAMSALVAVAGEPVGFLGLLLFGGGGAVYAVASRRQKPSRRSVAHGTLPGAQAHTALPVGIVLPAKRGYAVVLTVGAAVFVVAGAGLLLVGLAGAATGTFWGLPRNVVLAVVGVVAVGFFGVCGVLGVRAVVGARGGIALLPEGLYARAPAGIVWLRWEDLAWGSVIGQGTGAYLALSATSPEAITLSGLNRWLQGLNRRLFHVDVAYQSWLLSLPPERVLAVIHHYWADPAARVRLADPDAADLDTVIGDQA